MMTTSSRTNANSHTNHAKFSNAVPSSIGLANAESKIPTSILINKMNENRRLNDSNQSIELPTNKYNDYLMKNNVTNARSMSCRSARTLPVQMNASQVTSMMMSAMPSRNTSTSSSLLIAKTNVTNSQPSSSNSSSSSRIPIKSILNKNYMLLNNSQDQVLPTSSMSSSCTMPVISLTKHNSLLATRKHFSSYAIRLVIHLCFFLVPFLFHFHFQFLSHYNNDRILLQSKFNSLFFMNKIEGKLYSIKEINHRDDCFIFLLLLLLNSHNN